MENTMIARASLFTLLLVAVASSATEVVSPDASSATASAASAPRMSVRDYLQPRTATNPGGSDWPKQITFENVKPLSVDDFKSALINTWSPGFHCQGGPVKIEDLRSSGSWGGEDLGTVQYSFDGNKMSQRLVLPKRIGRPAKVETHSGPITVKSLGNNEFEVSFGGDLDLDPATWQVKRVKETGEIVIQDSDGQNANLQHCLNGKALQGLLLPVPVS